jgi:hypothetical protein
MSPPRALRVGSQGLGDLPTADLVMLGLQCQTSHPCKATCAMKGLESIRVEQGWGAAHPAAGILSLSNGKGRQWSWGALVLSLPNLPMAF